MLSTDKPVLFVGFSQGQLANQKGGQGDMADFPELGGARGGGGGVLPGVRRSTLSFYLNSVTVHFPI